MNSEKIIKTGIMIYDNVEYKVYICESDFKPGSGDYEDIPEIRNDKLIKCYQILFKSNDEDVFSSGGYYQSFEEAIRKVESNKQFKKWI